MVGPHDLAFHCGFHRIDMGLEKAAGAIDVAMLIASQLAERAADATDEGISIGWRQAL